MSSLHLSLTVCLPGVLIRKQSIRFYKGGGHGHRRGCEWDAGKEEVANDCKAAWRLTLSQRSGMTAMLKWE